MTTPKDALLLGTAVLDPVMSEHGFAFQIENEGRGSGGCFARGSYLRRERRLEVHYRYALGLVAYRIGDAILDHESYMRSLGVWGRNQYPGFPKDPLDSFRQLAYDIKAYGSDFLCGSGEEFGRFAEDLRRNPVKFKGLP